MKNSYLTLGFQRQNKVCRFLTTSSKDSVKIMALMCKILLNLLEIETGTRKQLKFIRQIGLRQKRDIPYCNGKFDRLNLTSTTQRYSMLNSNSYAMIIPMLINSRFNC
jgi:hypothetical protein